MNKQEYFLSEIEKLSDAQLVSMINGWCDKKNYPDDHVYWCDDEMIESMFGHLSVSEAYEKMCRWGDVRQEWIRFDAYGHPRCLDLHDLREEVRDAANEYGEEFLEFQDEVNMHNWDYEEYYKEVLRDYPGELVQQFIDEEVWCDTTDDEDEIESDFNDWCNEQTQ